MEFTLLGPIEAHQTRPPGYAAEVDWESLDLHRFERLFAAGRAALAEGDPGLASERLGEALGVFRDFWRTLDEELGIEPSAELKELERRILRQDPELDERRSPARRADVPGGHARPGVHYARSGDVSIAFQVVGEGSVDLVFVHGWVCPFQPGWENARITPLTGDYQHVAGQFNLNGLDATPKGKTLIVVQSTTGRLFTVSPNGVTRAITLANGESVPNGDGILLDGRTLYVVQNQLHTIAKIALSRTYARGGSYRGSPTRNCPRLRSSTCRRRSRSSGTGSTP